MWAGEDTQDGSAAASVSERARSEFGSSTSDAPPFNGRQLSEAASNANGYKGSTHTPGVLRSRDPILYKDGHVVLPAERAFSVQVGWRLFKLSGASILSDAPSYFSAYFEEQVRQSEAGNAPAKTLYIDRDPDTFADICHHLQGYWLNPRDGTHYQKLYADAQFYNLPRLASQLFESDIYTSIGGRPFQIPRDAFAGAGNSSNFFTLGFAGFIGTRDDPFPGLETRGLMRPPPAPPHNVPNRSPEIFEDLLNLSRGYQITIRDQNHRAALLSDCKYYGFKGLMHQIFACNISYNAERECTEILMRLEDLHKSGVSFYNDAIPSDQSPLGGWVYYARPFLDEIAYEVVIEIGNQETRIDFRSMRATFYGDTKARITSLFQTIADKMNLPSTLPLGLMMSAGGARAAPASPANTPLSEDRVKVHIVREAYITLDGQEHTLEPDGASAELDENITTTSFNALAPTMPTWQHQPSRQTSRQPSPLSSLQRQHQPPPAKKRKKQGSLDEFGEWIIVKGQWRLRVQPKPEPSQQQMPQMRGRVQESSGMEVVLWAVKLDAVSGQHGRNKGRGWIS